MTFVHGALLEIGDTQSGRSKGGANTHSVPIYGAIVPQSPRKLKRISLSGYRIFSESMTVDSNAAIIPMV